jgi:hypothetical protein
MERPNIYSLYSFMRRMHTDIICYYENRSYLNEIAEALVKVLAIERLVSFRDVKYNS